MSIDITDDNAGWTVRSDGQTWTLFDGAPDEPTVRLALDLDAAALLFSRGLTTAELTERVQPRGDKDLGALVVAGLAAFFGR